MRGAGLPARRLRRRQCFAARRGRRERRGGRIPLRGLRSRGGWRPVLSLATLCYSRGCFGESGLAPACVLVESLPPSLYTVAGGVVLVYIRLDGMGGGSVHKKQKARTRHAAVCVNLGTDQGLPRSLRCGPQRRRPFG